MCNKIEEILSTEYSEEFDKIRVYEIIKNVDIKRTDWRAYEVKN